MTNWRCSPEGKSRLTIGGIVLSFWKQLPVLLAVVVIQLVTPACGTFVYERDISPGFYLEALRAGQHHVLPVHDRTRTWGGSRREQMDEATRHTVRELLLELGLDLDVATLSETEDALDEAPQWRSIVQSMTSGRATADDVVALAAHLEARYLVVPAYLMWQAGGHSLILKGDGYEMTLMTNVRARLTVYNGWTGAAEFKVAVQSSVKNTVGGIDPSDIDSWEGDEGDVQWEIEPGSGPSKPTVKLAAPIVFGRILEEYPKKAED
jgi:hypothetical protein